MANENDGFLKQPVFLSTVFASIEVPLVQLLFINLLRRLLNRGCKLIRVVSEQLMLPIFRKKSKRAARCLAWLAKVWISFVCVANYLRLAVTSF